MEIFMFSVFRILTVKGNIWRSVVVLERRFWTVWISILIQATRGVIWWRFAVANAMNQMLPLGPKCDDKFKAGHLIHAWVISKHKLTVGYTDVSRDKSLFIDHEKRKKEDLVLIHTIQDCQARLQIRKRNTYIQLITHSIASATKHFYWYIFHRIHAVGRIWSVHGSILEQYSSISSIPVKILKYHSLYTWAKSTHKKITLLSTSPENWSCDTN